MEHECAQVDRLMRIEDDVENHKTWRSETSKQLNDIQILIATIDERMKNKMEKFDDHVREGGAFRTALVLTRVGMTASIRGSVYFYGGLAKQVEINTERWNKVIQHKEVQ